MAAKKAVSTGDKSATITVRLDPKLKYGLEILSRKQYRNLSSVVEWALFKALNDEQEGLEYLEQIWDVDEADRLVKLACFYPKLLNFDEQIVWKLIRENGYFWRGHYKNSTWVWEPVFDDAVWDRIRQYWPVLNGVAKGSIDSAKLPTWIKKEPERKKDLEDEIPF